VITGLALRIVGPLAVVAVLWLHGCHFGTQRTTTKYEALRSEAQATAARDALRRSEANIGVTDAAKKQATRHAAAAAGSRAELERLRNALADRVAASAPAGAGADEAAALRQLLGACAERYRAVAEDADRLVGQTRGLQDYAARVCVGAAP
jgi:hypothetical protein